LKDFHVSNRRLIISLTVLVSIVVFGTVGFWAYEESVHDLFEAFYLTIVTMTTVGYGDFVPTSDVSRVIASVVMVGGIGAGITALQSLFDVAVSRGIREELGLPQRRVRMKDHYIICGYGNVGMQLANQLSERNERFVIIENDELKVERLVADKIPVIRGDATEEEVLERAGIANAKGIFTTLKDPMNLVVVITAKTLNPDILVVSEVEFPINSVKIRKVGADAVVNCHEMGARVMVRHARRAVIDPVCGVEVDPARAAYKHEYEGETYYFCGAECYEAFLKNPKRFAEIRRTIETACGA